jgi:hypothetical protein
VSDPEYISHAERKNVHRNRIEEVGAYRIGTSKDFKNSKSTAPEVWRKEPYPEP